MHKHHTSFALFFDCILFLFTTGCDNGYENSLGKSADDPLGKPNGLIVTITEPRSSTHNAISAKVTTSNPIRFVGGAKDETDGPLSGNALVWTYKDMQSATIHDLGRGTGTGSDPVIETTLAAGNYLIHLSATNSAGKTKTAEKNLFINRYPINAKIIAPKAGEVLSFVPQQKIQFQGEVFDPDEGLLEGTSLRWVSRSITPNSFIPFAVGESMDFPFSPGVHTVWLLGYDSAGTGAGTNVQFKVIDNINNDPPVVSITSPAASPEPGSVFAYGSTVSFQGNAIDNQDGEIPGTALVWSSNIDGALGEGNLVICDKNATTPGGVCNKTLSPGHHIITLLAKDSGFLSGTSEIAITVTPPTMDNPPTLLTSKNFIDAGFVKGANLPNSVRLRFSARDDIGLRGYYIKEVIKWKVPSGPSISDPAWIPISTQPNQIYSDTVSYNLPPRSDDPSANYPLGAEVFFYIWFKDTADQLSVYASDKISYVDIIPPANSTEANNFATLIDGENRLTLSLRAEDLWGVTSYYVAENPPQTAPPSPSDPDWIAIAETTVFNQIVSYALKGQYTAGDAVELAVWFKDGAGNVSEISSHDFITF